LNDRIFSIENCGADAVAFSDESKYQDEPFGAVCVVTVDGSRLREADSALRAIVGDSDFGFTDVRSFDKANVAIALLEAIWPFIESGAIRIDVLSWSKSDSRTKVMGRDNVANLTRMLQHLVVNAIDKWDDAEKWDYVPDQHNAIPWDETWRPLDHGITKKRRDTGKALPEVRRPYPSDSKSFPLIQVADLFAGLAAHVREFPDQVLPTFERTTNSERARKPVIQALIKLLRNATTARFSPEEGITTPRHSPINMWAWKPQGAYDKAPTRKAFGREVDPDDESSVECSIDGCPEYAQFKQLDFKGPRCKEHLRELAISREETARAKALESINSGGEFYCVECDGFPRFLRDQIITSYDSDHDKYAELCPRCHSALTKIEGAVQAAKEEPFDIDKRTRWTRPYPGND
jgi:hypothetical protein